MSERLASWRRSLWFRIFAPNAAVLVIAVLVLAFSPATVSSPIAVREGPVIAAGLVVMIVLNLILLRRALAPLDELAAAMQAIDPVQPGERLSINGQSLELADVTRNFNAMATRLEAERADSHRRMISAQEGERRRVARELHDEIGQSITALMLEISSVADHAPADVATQLREVQEAARDLSSELRDLVRGLRPEALDDLGLASALNVLAERFSDRTGIEVVRRLEPSLPPVSADAELAIYRIAQEALTNVAKHSGASRVELALASSSETSVQLLVQDNGRGLRKGTASSGIRGMHERALLVGGTMRIGTFPGVSVILDVPAIEP